MRSCSRKEATASRITVKQRFSPSFGAYHRSTTGRTGSESQLRSPLEKGMACKPTRTTENTPHKTGTYEALKSFCSHRTSFGSVLFAGFFFAARFTRLAASRTNWSSHDAIKELDTRAGHESHYQGRRYSDSDSARATLESLITRLATPSCGFAGLLPRRHGPRAKRGETATTRQERRRTQ